ncbi:MAG: leucine-rich repeat domain-containing protein [Erysipelotrichales bacterium]
MKKRIIAFVFALAMLALPLNAGASNPEKISDIFPNERFAQTIADSLKKQPSDVVTQAELDGVRAVIKVAGTTSIDTIEGIGRLRNVETLILHGTSINEIPSEIKNLTKLKNIDINASPIKQAPAELEDLVSLERLDLAMNELNAFNVDLSHLPIKDVDLSQNKISEMNAKFPQAKKIKLSNNQLKRFPEALLASKDLESLDLGNNKLENISLGLNNLSELTELDVNTNMIVDKVPTIVLKEGQVDKWGLLNHTQVVRYDDLYLYTDSNIDTKILMPDIARQLKDDKGSLANVLAWQIKKPSGGMPTEVAANDASEIDFNSDLFKEYGAYNIDLASQSNSMRYWGNSSYSTKLVKINHEFPKASASSLNLTLKPGEEISDFSASATQGSTLSHVIGDDTIIEYTDGVIKGLKIGKTTITFVAKDEYNQSKEVVVNVEVKDKDIVNETLNITGLPKEVFIGDEFKLTPSIDDQKDNKGWSYDTKYLSAVYQQNNKFRALKKGETTITYTTKNGTSKTLKVVIKERKESKGNIAKAGADFMILSSIAIVLVLLISFKKIIRRV